MLKKREQELLWMLRQRPSTINRLREMTGLSYAVVYGALQRFIQSGLAEKAGTQANRAGGHWGRSFNVYQAVGTTKPDYIGTKALPITIPQYRWVSTRLG